LKASPSPSGSTDSVNSNKSKAGWFSAPSAIVAEKLDSPKSASTPAFKGSSSKVDLNDPDSISDLTEELQTCLQQFVEENAKLNEQVRVLTEENGELKLKREEDQNVIKTLQDKLQNLVKELDEAKAGKSEPAKHVDERIGEAKETLEHLGETPMKQDIDVTQLLEHAGPQSKADVRSMVFNTYADAMDVSTHMAPFAPWPGY
jgi:hypothetical protein